MTIEEYSFDHIMSKEKWQESNGAIIESGVVSVSNTRLCEIFKYDVQNDFYNFMDEKGLKENKDGIESIDVFRALSREDKRKYRTYKKILDECLWDDVYELDSYNLDSISYSLLELWEEKDKMYNQTTLMHFYYLALKYEHIADMKVSYRKYVAKEIKKAEKAGKDVKKLKLPNFYTWYFEQSEE
jgi:hypothetical protein